MLANDEHRDGVISSTPARGACNLDEPLDTLRLIDAMLGIL
jgi:hypothetical protein